MTEGFIRATREDIERFTLERLREQSISRACEIRIMIEALKRERLNVIGKDREVGVLKSIQEREATLVQHEQDLELIERMLKDYESPDETKNKPKQTKKDK